MRNGAFRVVCGGESASQIDVRVDVIRPELKRLAEESLLLAGRRDHAEVVEGRKVVRVGGESEPIGSLRLGKAAGLVTLHARREQGLGPARRRRRRPRLSLAGRLARNVHDVRPFPEIVALLQAKRSFVRAPTPEGSTAPDSG